MASRGKIWGTIFQYLVTLGSSAVGHLHPRLQQQLTSPPSTGTIYYFSSKMRTTTATGFAVLGFILSIKCILVSSTLRTVQSGHLETGRSGCPGGSVGSFATFGFLAFILTILNTIINLCNHFSFTCFQCDQIC